jgi:hypothetical protein
MKNRNDKEKGRVGRLLFRRGMAYMDYNRAIQKPLMDALKKKIRFVGEPLFSPDTMQRIGYAIEYNQYLKNLESVGLR